MTAAVTSDIGNGIGSKPHHQPGFHRSYSPPGCDESDDIAMLNIITELASSVKVMIFNIGKNESTMMVNAPQISN